MFNENLKLIKTLNLHTEENKRLTKTKERLLEENAILRSDKEIADILIKKRVAQGQQDKKYIYQMQERLTELERLLASEITRCESQEKALVLFKNKESEDISDKLNQLQKMLEIRNKELKKLKSRSSVITSQRSNIEEFFLAALNHVKKEIALKRISIKKEAEVAYNKQMLDAVSGKARYPKVCTFNKNSRSTNNIFNNLEKEEMLTFNGDVDIGSLTWEEKEKVLRHLFAKLNPSKHEKQSSEVSDTIQENNIDPIDDQGTCPEGSNQQEVFTSVFLTETEY